MLQKGLLEKNENEKRSRIRGGYGSDSGINIIISVKLLLHHVIFLLLFDAIGITFIIVVILFLGCFIYYYLYCSCDINFQGF
jgi:hypothetical protein